MLKKKILLGMLVLSSCTACITQATNIITGGREFVQLSNGEEGYFTQNKITKAETNQFHITSNGGGNRTYTFNGINYSNVFKILVTNRQVPSYIWLWNTNSELIYASSYIGKGYTPTKVCKIEDGDYTKINQDNCFTTDITELYTEQANLEYLTFGQQIDQTIDNISVRDRNAICFKFVNGVTYCIKCGIGANGCQGGQTQVFNNNGSYELQDYANIAGLSPFSAGPGTEGGPIACRSINDMIKSYGKVYNTGMCYTPSIKISGGQIVQTTPKSIFEIFSGFNQYQQLRTIYYNNCHTPYTQEHCINTMSGQEEAINFFNYIERTNENSNYNVIAERLYQYCWLNLQFTDEEKETEGTCTLNNDDLYAPGITEETGNPSLIDSISNILDEELGIGIVTPTTGTVFDEFLEDGETRLEGISINRIKTFKEAYTKVMGLFKYRQTQQGIIPGYIVSLIAIIVLLALFKK